MSLSFTRPLSPIRIRPCIALLLGLGTAAATAARAAAPERIIRGGSIVTVNPAQPTAAALAIADGKIIAVGDEADVLRLKGPNTEVSDLGGRTLVPGFIDGSSAVCSPATRARSAMKVMQLRRRRS